MEKAKKFICGCLNADRAGIINFGVGDSQEQNSKYKHGEILGLMMTSIKPFSLFLMITSEVMPEVYKKEENRTVLTCSLSP